MVVVKIFRREWGLNMERVKKVCLLVPAVFPLS